MRGFEILKTIECIESKLVELQAIFGLENRMLFLSPEYCLQAYRYENILNSYSVPYFVYCFDGDNCLGYIPFVKIGCVVRGINEIHNDHFGEVGLLDDISFFVKIINEIIADSSVKRIEIDNVISESLLGSVFLLLCESRVVILGQSSIPFLRKNNFSFLSNINSNQRSELRRVSRKSGDMSLRIIENDDMFPLSDILRLKNLMIYENLRRKDFINDSLISFFADLFSNGCLQLVVLHDDKLIRSLSFVIKGSKLRRLIWIDLYDPSIPYVNITSYNKYITYMSQISESIEIINFGRGAYDYKMKNFSPDLHLTFKIYFTKYTINVNLFFDLLKRFLRKLFLN